MSIHEMMNRLFWLCSVFSTLDEAQRKSDRGVKMISEMEGLVSKLKEAEAEVVMIHKDFWL
jgi:hypothetical protein